VLSKIINCYQLLSNVISCYPKQNASESTTGTLEKQVQNSMEALMIVNSILAASTIYFIKDAHSDFKEVVKKVGRLEEKVKHLSAKLGNEVNEEK